MIHSKCGGKIVNKKCEKCGKTWKPLGYLLAGDVEKEGEKKFSESEYKKRIRRGDDIWK